MSHTLTRSARRVGAVAGVLALAASGILVAVQGTANAQSTVPLDHFLCYQSRYNGPKAPQGIKLINVIQPLGFLPTIGAADDHCNPANKAIPGALFPAKNPLAHLLCYRIASSFKPVIVSLKNQFGTAVMKTGATPTQLCLPTWKSNIAPPNISPSQPPGLDHFTCYTVIPFSTTTYGFHTAGVKAEDEFSAPKYVPLRMARANSVCVPTIKVLPTGLTFGTLGPDDFSLVCFPTSPTPFWKVVYDQNQFGSSTVSPTNLHEEFCVPSTLSNQGIAG